MYKEEIIFILKRALANNSRYSKTQIYSPVTIEAVQSYLGIPADGIIGSKTKEAVKVFQKMSNLNADGLIGPATFKHILYSIKNNVLQLLQDASTQTGWYAEHRKYSHEVASSVQMALGIRSDGVLGPDSLTRIALFQKYCGIKDDGLIGPETFKTLIKVIKDNDIPLEITFLFDRNCLN